MFTPGPAELFIILVVVLLVFGPKRLPELGQQLGQAMRGFKDSISGEDEPERPEQEDRLRGGDGPPSGT